MMDVIFNGSGTRKSMSMAQVDLTFDNADGKLPIDQTEVVVSRRLYRSGESEYLLNKQFCRLKDIRELFLDTGIGVDAYSVIEQGRVDVLLQANPAERRMIFEEAAGISKYKVRKKEAQRRLERVNQNLLRVQDIVDEVEKRLRSVKLAAGKARNYQTYVQHLRELRSRYALAEFHRLRTNQIDLERETTELTDQVTRLRTELSDNDARSSQANVKIVELDRDISQTESELLSAAAQVSAGQERIAAAQRRIEDQTDLLRRSDERLDGFNQQTAALTARIDEQTQSSTRIETELGHAHRVLADLQESDRQSAHDLNEAQRHIEDEKAGIIDLLRRTSQLHNEITGLSLQHETLVKQKAQLDERDAVIAAELADAMSRQSHLRARETEIDQLLADQNRKLADTRSRSETISAERIVINEQHAAAKEYRSGLESRRDVLAELDRKHEGLLAGAREILEKRDAGGDSHRPFTYVLGAVGELFEVDVAHASLVEAVLGHFEKYLVVTQRDLLLADSETLGELSGTLRAFCLDSVPPTIAGPDLVGQEGVIARLLDWVRHPESCQRLARHLLGRTYVVESTNDARRLATLDPSARFVTMSGILWEPDGRIGAGPLGSGTGLISRRSELRELAAQITEVESRIADLAETLTERASEITHLEDVQQQLRTAIYDANTHRVEARAQLSTLDDAIRQRSEERPLIAAEVSILVNHMNEVEARQTAGRFNLGQLQGQSDESQKKVVELQARIDGLTRERHQVAEQLTTTRVRAGELSQQRASLADAMRELQANAIQLQADRATAESDVAEARRRIEQTSQQIEEARKTLEQLLHSKDELTARSASLRQQRDDQRALLDQCAAEARSLRASLESAEASLHEQQIKLQEARIRAEDLIARIAEELSVNLEEQYAGYQPETTENWPAVEAEMTDLRQKIERLGNVNIDAIDEQSQLETRLNFLTTQLDDLRSSESQLLALIEKLNDESKQRFMDTFKSVSEHFTALFKKLFGGGKAELTLMDQNDVLECGIEIMARPPGKEPQSISLLSGGEKTMTAIALLLAVFRSRPSPFVLLDEVDAALDEANNVRFNHVIREFTELSQFILITHSKRTMSIADVLYGITMQEAGVSQRVGVRFDDDRQAVA
jgi:chromosome segregation protein